jgi:hypothetical protein
MEEGSSKKQMKAKTLMFRGEKKKNPDYYAQDFKL